VFLYIQIEDMSEGMSVTNNAANIDFVKVCKRSDLVAQISIRINEGLKESFIGYCDNVGLSMTDVLIKFINNYLIGAAPAFEIDDFYNDTLGEDEKRLNLRIDEDLRTKLNEKCKCDNLTASFLLRGYVAKCASIYDALVWWSVSN